MEENIDKIIKEAIAEIKEKVKKNSKYLNPMNREFQEDTKKFGFPNTGRYVVWLQQNGILRNPTKVKQEYDDRLAREKGFKNEAEQYRDSQREYKREWVRNKRWDTGVQPMTENDNCGNYLGIVIGENLSKPILKEIFGGIEKEMPPFYSGYEFIVKGKYKIDVKTAKLQDALGRYGFKIRHNNIADYFLLIAFDNIDNIETTICVWLINKNELIRYGKKKWEKRVKFYDRDSFYIFTEHLEEFSKYEWTHRIKGLKEYIKKLKEVLG